MHRFTFVLVIALSLASGIERVLTGSNGEITIQIQSKLISLNPATFVGHWVIVYGTGAYANLHGEGERTATGSGRHHY